MPKVIVIGGGAAGYFAALSCKQHHPDADVAIIEKSNKVLSKVKISGGGRCNVTNSESDIKTLAEKYPRGGKQLRKLFGHFNTTHTIEWFESRGVKLKEEAHGHMFPVTDNSQTIIDCFQNEAQRLGIKTILKANLTEITPGFTIKFKDREPLKCDKIIVATGGHPKIESFEWMEKLGHNIVPPVPSLFTFNIPNEPITKLMGLVAGNGIVKIRGTKLKASGPLLITHWGMSGPAVLKLSAWGARDLHKMNYDFSIQVSWIGETNETETKARVQNAAATNGSRMLKNMNPFELPARLWTYLLERAVISPEIPWEQFGPKLANKLSNILINDDYKVKGKTTFKEEFVTAGGVDLKDIDISNMESKVCPGMYFAGEVLDIDGTTGGFNFQAAWTTAYFAGMLKSNG